MLKTVHKVRRSSEDAANAVINEKIDWKCLFHSDLTQDQGVEVRGDETVH